MKIFIFDKKMLYVFLILISFVAIVLPIKIYESLPVAAVNKELPIYCVENGDKSISITFDSAWGNEDIDQIIEVLNNYNCKATFFVVGEFIDKYPQSVKKLAENGHEIANHSNSHAHYNLLSRENMIMDMNKCDEKIKNLIGKENVIFRAPYGEYNTLLVRTCKETNRYCIQWNIDSLDYKGLTAEQMENRIMEKIKGGSIILFHTGTKNTAAALPQILNSLKNEGYKFKTISNLIYKDNYYIDHTGKQILN